MVNLTTEIAGIKLKNPILLASGIAGFGEEYSQLIDLNIFGAFVTKTITLEPRAGNPPPRIVETSGGMVNSIGLENPGLEVFLKEKLPFLKKKLEIPIIVSISAENTEKFVAIVHQLNKERGNHLKSISAIELNLSCPNIRSDKQRAKGEHLKSEELLISQDPDLTYQMVKRVKKVTRLPIIAKLTPNVTDITIIAQAAESAGADALALVNTFSALAFPPSLSNPLTPSLIFGGLSGPAIKPIVLRMIYKTYQVITSQKVKIPIIGMGGINSEKDALEFFLVGAKAIALGSALFCDPLLPQKILISLKQYLKTQKISLKELVGKLQK